jgi:hypothetical protein
MLVQSMVYSRQYTDEDIPFTLVSWFLLCIKQQPNLGQQWRLAMLGEWLQFARQWSIHCGTHY